MQSRKNIQRIKIMYQFFLLVYAEIFNAQTSLTHGYRIMCYCQLRSFLCTSIWLSLMKLSVEFNAVVILLEWIWQYGRRSPLACRRLKMPSWETVTKAWKKNHCDKCANLHFFYTIMFVWRTYRLIYAQLQCRMSTNRFFLSCTLTLIMCVWHRMYATGMYVNEELRKIWHDLDNALIPMP